MNFGTVTFKFGEPLPGISNSRHNGIDLTKGTGSLVVAPEGGSVIFSGKTKAYRVISGVLKLVYEPTVIIDGQSYYHVFTHLQNRDLPALGPIRENALIGYQRDIYHWGVFRKLGPWRSITHAEVSGWAVDPLSINWESMRIKKEYLQGNVFQVKGRPEVYWHIPSPEAFGEYIGDWGLIEQRDGFSGKNTKKIRGLLEEALNELS